MDEQELRMRTDRANNPRMHEGGIRNHDQLTTAADGRPLANTPDSKQQYRVRADAPHFYHQGTEVGPGDVIEATELQARAASRWIETLDGDRVKHESEAAAPVPRANLAGMARHERVGALEAEEAQLVKRLEAVREQLADERGAMEQDIERRRAAQPAAEHASGGGLSVSTRPIADTDPAHNVAQTGVQAEDGVNRPGVPDLSSAPHAGQEAARIDREVRHTPVDVKPDAERR